MLLCVGIAIFLFLAGFCLLLHHGYKHMNDPLDSKAKQESVQAVCFFQISDISNHETWILVLWSNAATIMIMAGILGGSAMESRH